MYNAHAQFLFKHTVSAEKASFLVIFLILSVVECLNEIWACDMYINRF